MIFLIVRFRLFSWMLRYLNLRGSPTEQRFNDAEGDEEEGAAEDKEAGDDDEIAIEGDAVMIHFWLPAI